MGEKGITKMELKVDLQCHRCYKKVKKVLCKFPEIHDQIFDEKKNTVTITVVCCCPEKIMRKIRCKGGNSILCIKILPPPPKEEKKKEDKKEEPKEKEKRPLIVPWEPYPKGPWKDDPVTTDQVSDPQWPDVVVKRAAEMKKEEAPPPKDVPVFVPFCPPVYGPIAARCTECSEGRSGGPCFQGQGQPRPCYVDYGRPVYDSYGTGGWYGDCHVSRCDYFCEEYPSGCTVM